MTPAARLYVTLWRWRIFVSCSSSGWTRRFVDMDSCRISGFVFGPVLCHRSTVPVPLASGVWDLSPLLLHHLPHHCASYRVWNDPRYIDLTPFFYMFMHYLKKNPKQSAVTFVPLAHYPVFLWLGSEAKWAKSAQGGLKLVTLCLLSFETLNYLYEL